MKRVGLIIGVFVCIVIICIVGFAIKTRPLISSEKAMEIAKHQLSILGYMSPYNDLTMGTFLGWNNKGKLFSTQRVYFTTIALQPKPGASVVNVEVVEDARSGNIVSVFQYNTPPGNPFF